MKKLILFLSAAFLITLYGYSQSLSLSNAAGPIVGNSTIVQPGTPDSVELITYLNVKNISNKTIDVLCKKAEIKMLDSTEVTICWAGGCYPSNVNVSPNSQTMAAGETNTEFVGHYTQIAFKPFKVGESVIRWTFYDKLNANDSVSVTVKYTTYPAGISDPMAALATMQLFPNPASSYSNCTYAIPAASEGSLLIRDMLGKTVYSQNLSSGNGRLSINTASLNEGFYFCSLLVDGQVAQTKKLVVKH